MPTEESLQELMDAFHITREQAVALDAFFAREGSAATKEAAIEHGEL